ncbi:ASPIC and UnbV [compost metagenome]
MRSGGSYLSHNDMRVHFGLADATIVDRLEIRWPLGLIESVEALGANRFYSAIEGKGVTAR